MSELKVIFRTDASFQIGTGHVMRCLTLAKALRDRGAECQFICREHSGNLMELIRKQGFDAMALPVQESSPQSAGTDEQPLAHSSWLGADWRTDAEQTKIASGEMAVDWLIVDHYALDARWELALRPHFRKIMVIDDLADRSHDCDLLLDQNLGRNAIHYVDLVPDRCTILAGTEYALLRPEFAAMRAYSLARRATPQLKHLLITMGGVDKDDATGKVLDALRGCHLSADSRITVVMGQQAPWLKQVLDKAAAMPWPTEVLANVHVMAKLMADSDLAIGAAGTSAWERCCLGLPSLTMILAANQKEGAFSLQQAGAAWMIDNGADMPSSLKEKLSLLLQPEILEELGRASCAVTTGSGAIQLAKVLAE